MNNFEKLRKQGLPDLINIKDTFRKYGFIVNDNGMEYKLSGSIKTEITKVKDNLSYFIRFQPDMLFINPQKTETYFGEHKWTSGPNYDIQLECFETCKNLSFIFPKKIFIVISMNKYHFAFWIDEAKPFELIIPSNRWDIQEFNKMNYKYKNICKVSYKSIDKKNGSGTRFFLINPKDRYIKPLKEFIKKELL